MPEIYRVKPDGATMNILLYGSPGVGKTTLAATAQDHPSLRDVLFLNVEGGLLTISGRGDIQAVDVRTMGDLEQLFWNLRDRKGEYAAIKTVVIDSGSELQTLNVEEIVTTSKKQHPDRDTVFLEDWGKSTQQLRRVFRWFRDLPINVIVTALPKNTYRGQGSTEIAAVKPSFTDKLGESVMGYVDAVWYMYVTPDGVRHLLTRKRGVYEAKTRGIAFAAALGEVVDEPTIPELYETFLRSEGALSRENGQKLVAVATQAPSQGQPAPAAGRK